MARLIAICAILGLMTTLPARAALVTEWDDQSSTDGAVVDGTISSGEYNGYNYTGGGSGFGGPLGGGMLSFDSAAGTLYIGATINGNLGGNIISVFLDTRPGGFNNDSTLGDFADGGRAVASKLTRDVQDNLPINADFVLEFGNGFTNLFELKTGSLNFIAPTAAGTGGQGGAGTREASIPLSTLGMIPGQPVDFFAVLISDTNFSSNEGIPNPNIASNPGFENNFTFQPVTWPDYDRFVTAPEPSAFLVCGLVAVCGGYFVKRMRRI